MPCAGVLTANGGATPLTERLRFPAFSSTIRNTVFLTLHSHELVAVKKLFNLPNNLTLSRIFLVPLILWFLSLGNRWSCFVAAVLFCVAAITDLFDGYLARKANQVTSFGKFLDPLADKVLVCSVLIMLVELGWVPAWVAIVIICRDIMVTGLRAIAADEGVVIAADTFGKVKTVMQLVALIPLVLHHPWLGVNVHFWGTLVLYVAVVLTVYSGGNYFYRFYRSWAARRSEQGAAPAPEAR